MDVFNVLVGLATVVSAFATIIPYIISVKNKRTIERQVQNQPRPDTFELEIPAYARMELEQIRNEQERLRIQQEKDKKRRKVLRNIATFSLILTIILGSILFYRLKTSTNKVISSNNLFPTPVPTHWHTILTQTAPYCSKPSQAEWYVIPEATHYSCNASSLIMWQEQPPSPSLHFAEIDLEKVDGAYYDQTNFRLQVQVNAMCKFS